MSTTPSPGLIPIALLVGMSTAGCSTLHQNPRMCKAATSLLGATLGGVGGGVGVDQIESGPDDGERAAGAAGGALVGGLIGFAVGHFACEPEAPPPPPPRAAAPPRPQPGTKVVELKAAHFDFNKAVLKPTGKERVNEAVRLMETNSGLRVSIEGHTDSVGSDPYNVKLGRRRANAVKAYMVSQRVPASQIAVHSFGEARPVASNATADGRAENRRVEIIAE